MRTKKAFKNLVFNFIQQLVGIITNFILPPLIIGKFGSSMNGLVSTIKQMMSYAQLTGAGISASSTYAMYEPLAKKDYKTLSGIYNATSKMFTTAGNLFTIIVLALSLTYPFFVEGIDYFTVVLLVFIVGVSGISEFYVYGKYQSIINANQSNYIIAVAQTVGNLANIVISIILIKLNFSIVVVQLGASVIYLLRILILTYFVKKNYPYLDKKVIPMMEKIDQRNDAIIHQIAGLVVLSSSTIIVSFICGLEAASIYSIYALVFGGINTICSIVSTAIYASFGEIIANEEKELLKSAFNVYECIYFFVISIIFVVAYIMIMPFISVYTASMTDANYYLPILGALFVLVGVANNLRVPARTVVDAAGHFKETKNRSLIEMIINLVGQISFAFIFGIYGVLLGCILSYSYRTFDFIIYSNKRIVKRHNFTSFKRIIISFVIGFILVFLVMSFIPMNINGYLSWVFYAFITTLLVGIVYLIVYLIFERKTMIEIFKILKNLVA